MKIVSIQELNDLNNLQQVISEIAAQEDKSWSIAGINDAVAYNQTLVGLAGAIDLSEIFSYIEYNDTIKQAVKNSVWNTVGQYAVLAEIAKQHEGNLVAWKNIKSILEHVVAIENKPEDYCGLIRGWNQAQNKGEAQGDQILKILLNDVNATINNPDKWDIFKILVEETKLYNIPGNYQNNGNVKKAAQDHNDYVKNELPAKLQEITDTACADFENNVGKIEFLSDMQGKYPEATGNQSGINLSKPENFDNMPYEQKAAELAKAAANIENVLGANTGFDFSALFAMSASIAHQLDAQEAANVQTTGQNSDINTDLGLD